MRWLASYGNALPAMYGVGPYDTSKGTGMSAFGEHEQASGGSAVVP